MMQPPTTGMPQSMERKRPANSQITYDVTTSSIQSNSSKIVSNKYSVHALAFGESAISTKNKTIIHGNYAYANTFTNLNTITEGSAPGTTSSVQNNLQPAGGVIGSSSSLRSDPVVGPENNPNVSKY